MPDEDKTMTLGEHLTELRRRVIICLLVTGLAFFAVFAVFFTFKKQTLALLCDPVVRQFQESEFVLRTLEPFEGFMVMTKLSLIAALVMVSPVIIYQIWAFITPGLKDNELQWAKPILGSGVVLFAGGVALCYLLVVPTVFSFFLRLNVDMGVDPAWSLDSFIHTELMMLAGFGLAFELPLVIAFLALIGLVTPETLVRRRKYAILLIVIGSAVLTPDPSAITMLIMAIPLCVLYEASIIVVKVIYSRRRKRAMVG